MRESLVKYHRTLLFWLVLGFFINLAIAYLANWISTKTNFNGSDTGGGNWDRFVQIESEWYSRGTTFGVSESFGERWDSEPPGVLNGEGYFTQIGGVISYHQNHRRQIGWPLRCIQQSEFSLRKVTLLPQNGRESGRASGEVITDVTPKPYWYFKGIETEYNAYVFRRIPIHIRPLQLLINTLFYSAVLYKGHRLFLFSRKVRRKRKGLCLVCGYAVEDLEVCPECGVERVGDRCSKFL